MIQKTECKVEKGFYSKCESHYDYEAASGCEINITHQNEKAACPSGTGTNPNLSSSDKHYRAFCTTCYAGTFSSGNDTSGRECKKCTDGYACGYKYNSDLSNFEEPSPNAFFDWDDFFAGKHQTSSTFFASPTYCTHNVITQKGVTAYSCETEEDFGWEVDEIDVGELDGENTKKPLFYYLPSQNQIQPGIKKGVHCGDDDHKGSEAFREIDKYGVTTPSGIERGATVCKPCDKGFYAKIVTADSEVAECKPCPVGTYQDKEGKWYCKPCPQRTYQDEEGQANCKVCPDPWMTTVVPGTDRGAKSVDDCDVSITTMHFTTTGTDVCSWQWPAPVEGGSFMQNMNVTIQPTYARYVACSDSPNCSNCGDNCCDDCKWNDWVPPTP